MNLTDILREANTGARAGVDAAYTVGRNAVMQPVSGLVGLAKLLRSGSLDDAVQGIEDTQAIAGGPRSQEGAELLDKIGRGVQYVMAPLSKGVDAVGEQSPAAGAALAAAGAVLDPSKVGKVVKGLRGVTRAEQLAELTPAAGAALKTNKSVATVKNPHSVTFPGIYDDPRELVARAKVAPEDPLLKQLFGVTRDDLYDIAEQGTRQGNITEAPFNIPQKARGSAAAQQVMNPRNTQRLVDILTEARERPDLFKGMASWYTMDPAYQRLEQLLGPERAKAEYMRFNTLTGMASPGSEVLTELNRGTAANWLAKEGRFGDFEKYAGMAEAKRGANFPDDMRDVLGHAYHKTAQAAPMRSYLDSGELQMQSAKVPSYIAASGVPETGFQTAWPVGDAHWSRLVGLPDVRGMVSAPGKGGLKTQAVASAEVPEMATLGPWWRDKVAGAQGLEAVPAQAVVWGAGSNATGVTSPIGAPKLELLAQQIGKTAQRLGVSPETARDMVLLGKTHAGFADPALLGGVAAGGAGAAALAKYLRQQQQPDEESSTGNLVQP
jgi:hypothetical protein